MRKVFGALLGVIIIPVLLMTFSPPQIIKNSPKLRWTVLIISLILLVLAEMPLLIKRRKRVFQLAAMPIAKSPLRGRDEKVRTVSNFFKGSKSILVIEGASGIGKTTLFARCIEKQKKSFDFVVWQPLYDVPTAREIINGWLGFLSSSIPDTSLNSRIDFFLNEAKKMKCKKMLIAFDNAESIFKSNSTGQLVLPNEYKLLIKRLVEFREIKIKIVLTTAVEAPFDPLTDSDILTLLEHLRIEALSTPIIQAIIKDRTGRELPESMVSYAAGNPSAALILAGLDADSILEPGTSFRGLVEKHLQALSSEQKALLVFLSVVKLPIVEADIREENNALFCTILGQLGFTVARITKRPTSNNFRGLKSKRPTVAIMDLKEFSGPADESRIPPSAKSGCVDKNACVTEPPIECPTTMTGLSLFSFAATTALRTVSTGASPAGAASRPGPGVYPASVTEIVSYPRSEKYSSKLTQHHAPWLAPCTKTKVALFSELIL